MKIEFIKETLRASFLDPTKNFELDIHEIERRKDPLTKKWCRINVRRAKRPKQIIKSKSDIEKIIRATRSKCDFCPENIEKRTPRFIKDLVPEGRIRVRNFVLFPNLFPFDGYHAIGVLTKNHFLPLNKFEPKIWEDCIIGCIKFFKILKEKDKKAIFPSINFNYLQPSGASIIHPHVQIIITKKPTFYLDKILKNCRRYFLRNHSNYWDDLVKIEKRKKERYVGKIGSTEWLCSFAPMLNNEVIGITKKSRILDLTEHEIKCIAEGISRILKAYSSLGIESVNATIYSTMNDAKYFRCIVRIVSRKNITPYYCNDRGFMEGLHEEPVIETLPEDLAFHLKSKF
jgi:galactose-1-phosphate uridylyltransferase